MSVQSMLTIFVILLTFASCSSSSSSASDGLLIGAFNVQILGKTKVANTEVLEHLVQIIRRYDVILIQEIRDKTDFTLQNLMNALNTQQNDSGVTVLRRHQYENKINDVSFERPPFSVRLRSTKSAITEFVLTAIHTKPEAAVKEIDALKNVHSELRSLWNTDNILIMGDLNAACRYASPTALNKLHIRKDPPYHWLIPDDAITTAPNSTCAYDRFIMTGVQFKSSLVANSARVFYYNREFGLSLEQTRAVSDHFPIELRLRPASSSNPLDLLAEAADAIRHGKISHKELK